MSSCHCSPNEVHGMACPIIREFRTPKDQLRDEYRQLIRRRQEELAGGNAVDIPYKLQQLGVPRDAIKGAIAPITTVALDAARRFNSAPRETKRSLILVGHHGVGKSVAAAFVMAHWAKHYDWNSMPSGGKQFAPAFWCHAAELTSATDFGKVDPEWLEGLKRCQLLVVDELGHEGTLPGLSALRDVLTLRHEKHKATVITSNLAPDDFKSRYGDSWYERLKVAALVPDLRKEKSLRKKMT